MRLTLLSCCFLLASAISATAADWPRHEVYTGARVNAVTAADYNGDGHQEIIFSAAGQTHMALGPDYRTTRVLATDNPKLKGQCIHCALHDVDGDGDLDFVGSHVEGVFWLECPDQDPTTAPWTKRTLTDEIFGVHCLRSFDVDADGKPDLVANNFKPVKDYPNSVCRLEPTVHPTSKATACVIIPIADKDSPGGNHYFDFGDLNGDGRPDMAIGAKGKPFPNGNYFAIYLQGPDPLRPWTRRDLPNSGKQVGATHAAPADVNGDGKTDVIATRGHGVGIVWFEAPTWREHVIDADIAAPHAADFLDIDGDGDVDLAAVGYQSKLAAWYENDGSGRFTRYVLSRDQMAYDVMITDLDGDGHRDVLIAGQGSNNVVWFENPAK